VSAGLQPGPDSTDGTGGTGGTGETQDEPRLDIHETSEQERLDGLVAQLRADVTGESPAVVEQAVRRRFEETGVAADESRIRELIAELVAGASD